MLPPREIRVARAAVGCRLAGDSLPLPFAGGPFSVRPPACLACFAVLTPHSFTDFDRLAVLDSTAYHRGGLPLPP